MSNHNDEPNRGGLENLPENEQKETKEILDQIEKEEADKTDTTTQDDAAKAEAEKKAKEEADAKAKADKEAEEARKGKEDRGRFIPSWVLEKERAQSKAKIAELEKAIADAAGSKKNDNGEETKVEKSDRIKEAIKKHNIEVAPEFMEEIVKIASEGRDMPEDLAKRLEDLDKLKHDKEVEVEEANFNRDFDTQVVPLIKAEYGEDIDPAKIAEIKETLKSIAYTTEYAKVPYEEIYNGKKDFRGIATPKKRSAESGRSGGNTISGEGKNYTEMSEEEVKNLSGDEFDKWSEAMAKDERQKK